jgi:hypothetical protein
MKVRSIGKQLKQTCHDCGVSEGQLHKPGCDMEQCPFCGGQLISCDCCYEIMGIDCSPGSKAYKNGLTKTQSKIWNLLLTRKGLVPFIVFPNLCARCGQLWPDTFLVLDAEWKKYVPILERGRMLCRSCFDLIKELIDGAQKGK